MSYKKYIEKDGKVYGPYVYRSRRVNGKIVSEYCGQGNKNNKKILILAAAALALIFLVFSFFIIQGKFTGNVVSENVNLISSERENVISYPIVYFTLISISQTSNLNDSSEQDSSEEAPINNETNLPGNSSNTEINSSEQEEVAIDNSTVQEETNSSEEIPSELADTKENLPDSSDLSQEAIPPESSQTEETSPGDIAVSEVLNNVAAFFLGILKPTGMTVSEATIETKIDGKTSMNEPFIYQLKEGENVQLLSGSVKTNSDSLPDSVIKLTYQDNLVLVSTNYSELIKAEEESKNSTLNIIKKISTPALTAEEKNILSQKFNNLSIETIKSELFNGRYVIGYKLGDFTIEYSYDSNLDNETLKSQIESDKTKWLKDISIKISEKEPVHNSVTFP